MYECYACLPTLIYLFWDHCKQAMTVYFLLLNMDTDHLCESYGKIQYIVV
jgi:hypothetical protein